MPQRPARVGRFSYVEKLEEAVLATLAILVWHLYFVVFMREER